MKLATLRDGHRTRLVRVDSDVAVPIPGFVDVGALLQVPDWMEIAKTATGSEISLDEIDDRQWAPTVTSPSKIFCVGLNYRNHITEMGRELPSFPTLFAKFKETLVGAYDDIALPTGVSSAVDWEGELAVIIGSTTRRVDVESASKAIGGYSVLNDVSVRDYQYRTTQWLQGKTFEATTPLGPYMLTSDEFETASELTTTLNGEVVQRAITDDMVFTPSALVAYISQIITLNPGDVIATGTPGGVGHARSPARYLAPGDTLVTSIGGLGEQRNRITREA